MDATGVLWQQDEQPPLNVARTRGKIPECLNPAIMLQIERAYCLLTNLYKARQHSLSILVFYDLGFERETALLRCYISGSRAGPPATTGEPPVRALLRQVVPCANSQVLIRTQEGTCCIITTYRVSIEHSISDT